jgi:hypothetical protein
MFESSRELPAGPPGLDLSCEVTARFKALPRVPLLLLSKEQDEDFPAKCSLLFQRQAEKFLDLECLAICGWLLADSLAEKAGLAGRTVM